MHEGSQKKDRVQSATRKSQLKFDRRGKILRKILKYNDEVQSGIYQQTTLNSDFETNNYKL